MALIVHDFGHPVWDCDHRRVFGTGLFICVLHQNGVALMQTEDVDEVVFLNMKCGENRSARSSHGVLIL